MAHRVLAKQVSADVRITNFTHPVCLLFIAGIATAEAIALEHNKPLFAITCGDLGFTPQGVEKSLNEIFRLANLWDCILLLDEADVFLSQREKTDLKRNALVSVFLR